MHSPSSPNNLPQASLLAIDPGFRYLGFSVFNRGELVKAGLSKAEDEEDWDRWTNQPPSFLHIIEIIHAYHWESPVAVIEFPKIHRDTPKNESIIKLAAACGAYASLLQAAGFVIEWVEPRAWKGTVPKDIMYKRILAKLPESEYHKIERLKDHNVIDAVGIGLWKIRKSPI